MGKLLPFIFNWLSITCSGDPGYATDCRAVARTTKTGHAPNRFTVVDFGECVVYHGFVPASRFAYNRGEQSVALLTAASPVPTSINYGTFMSTVTPQTRSHESILSELHALQERSPLFRRPGFLIRRMHQIHGFLFAEETGDFDITPVQYSLLTALVAFGELDQNTLAVQVGLERSSVAEVIPRLQARGLVDRTQASHDKRLRLVKLTLKGRRLVAKMSAAVQRAHDRTIDHLSPEERDLFMLMMIKLVEAKNTESLVPFKLPD
jgi:DNA-binding MarR family transcriptional regulator